MGELARWRVVAATAWAVVAAGAWFVARVEDDLHLCRTSVTRTGAVASVETERAPRGRVRARTTTDTPEAVESSTVCEPVGAIELGVLAVPVLLLTAPALKSLTIAGVGIELREVRRKVEDLDAIVQLQDAGSRAERVVTHVESNDLVDLSTLPKK